jgi:hypothetical protein
MPSRLCASFLPHGLPVSRLPIVYYSAMTSWLSYLKSGLQRSSHKDRLTSATTSLDLSQRLKNLRPYLKRY